jgi:formylglycine-generating enzyme required for sulfatase activity
VSNPEPDNLPRVIICGGSWNSTDPAGVRAAYRSGSWNSTDPAEVRAANRYALAPSFPYYGVGFRCALRVRQPVGKVGL